MTKDYSIFDWDDLRFEVGRYHPTLCGYTKDYSAFIVIRQFRENGPLIGYALHPTENKLLQRWYLNREQLNKYKARIGVDKL